MSAIVRVNEGGATVVVSGAALVTESLAAATAAANAAAADRAITEAARDAALSAIGEDFIYSTKADADAALASVPANKWVKVRVDETQGGASWHYQKVSGVYVSRGAALNIGPTTSQMPALVSDRSDIVAVNIAPPTGMTNSAGGNDAVNVRFAAIAGQLTNGPPGHVNYYNTVCGFGVNTNSNWTQVNPSKPSATMRIESKFYQEGCFGAEFHWSVLTTGAAEFRVMSAFVPHNAADWPTKGGLSINGSYISLSDGHNQNRHFIDGRTDIWGIVNPAIGNAMQFQFGQNDRAPMTQLNAAGNAFLPLPYLNTRNEIQTETPTFHVAARALNAFGAYGMSAAAYTGAQANDVVHDRAATSITGNITFVRDIGEASGMVQWLQRNAVSGGRAVSTLMHTNGVAALAFENAGTGAGSFQIRFDHATDETIFDDGLQGQGGGVQSMRIARTTGRVRFVGGVGFNNVTPIARRTVAAAATDAATTQALVNELRTLLIDLGLAQ